jgi:two-component system nitrogen regulation sensor histidine kinase GlnL
LLQNALDAASEVHVPVDAAAGKVVVSLHRIGDEALRFSVSNTGPEPPAKIRDRLFEPLVSGKPEGAGLGLAIAHEVVEKHRGRLTYEPREGLTEFVVHLPLSPRQHSVPAGTSEKASCGKIVDC